jgi:polyhydroxyalkanoate synthesis regulator phasin
MAKSTTPRSDRPSDTGFSASVVRLGNESAQLVGRLWDDAQTLVRGRTPREVASRLAAGALDASAEARRQATELLRRLGGQSSRLVAVLENDVARLSETISERLGVASRNELTDLGRRIAALDRRLEALAREGDANVSQAPFPLPSDFN